MCAPWQLIALTVVYSSTTLLDGFVLGVVLALVGYFLSERYKRSVVSLHGECPLACGRSSSSSSR